jgi:hypothetical protein
MIRVRLSLPQAKLSASAAPLMDGTAAKHGMQAPNLLRLASAFFLGECGQKMAED